MRVLRTRVKVKEDGTVEARLPGALPPGEHKAVIIVEEPPAEKPEIPEDDFPVHDEPWDDSISLRREDM